ncbi:MAG: hypothetical protein ABIW82_17995 [Dokdonella sp.]
MQRLTTWVFVLFAVSVPFAPASANIEGYYDPAFAGSGHELVDVSASTSDKGRILRIQTGGKLLMGGTCGTGSLIYFCATRLDASGTKDLGFGPDGTGTITFDRFFGQGFPTSDTLGDMLSLSDGRILFLGLGTLAMLNAGGTALDTGSGGGSGYVGVFGKYALAEQADHKILAVGYAGRNDASGNVDMVVQRFLPDLSIDTSFGTSGSQSVIFNLGSSSSFATSVALQTNGNIVLGGYVTFTGQPGKSAAIARLLPNGQLDPAFGGGGPIYQTPYGVEDAALAVRIDQKGRIVYGGYGATDTNFGTRKCLINRLLPNGNQDFSFNANQPLTFTVPVGANNVACEIVDVAPQPDGTVLAVGSLLDVYFTAARLTSSGSFDSTFGASGISYAAFDPSSASSTTTVRSGAMAIGNGLMIAGTNFGSDDQFGIAQLTLTVHIFANGFDD